MSDHRQKARDLIRLAVDARTPEAERVVAAVQAVGLIHRHELLESRGPKSKIYDTISNFKEILTDPALRTALGEISAIVDSVKPPARERRRRRR